MVENEVEEKGKSLPKKKFKLGGHSLQQWRRECGSSGVTQHPSPNKKKSMPEKKNISLIYI